MVADMKTKHPRDLTARQMESKLMKHGIIKDCFGYWDIGGGVLIYARNGGDRRRHQVHYLISQKDRITPSA